MRTLTNGTLTVLAYNQSVWKQEHNILRVTDPQAYGCAILYPDNQTQIAYYTLDENGSVDIDMSDFIRTQDSGVLKSLYVRTDGDAQNMVNANFKIVGLISPESVLIPHFSLGGFVMVPPKHMLMGVGSAGIAPEYYCTIAQVLRPAFSILTDEGTRTTSAISSLAPMTVQLPSNTARLDITTRAVVTTTIETYNTKPLECDKRYAAVRWVSFTGKTRVHTWEVTKAKTATDGAIELLTIDGSYNTLKGREDGFVLRLEGLNAYDLWYYADIITSSQVEVSMDGSTWQRVEITTKDVAIPDGDAGKLNTLEVNCNWRKYDAITL